MGSFAGHVLPGTLLFIVGTWWSFSVWRVYILSRVRRRNFICTASFRLPILPKKLCFEGLAKIACSLTGVGALIGTAYVDGVFTPANNQHMSMYGFYGLSGLADILTIHGAPVPRGTDYGILLLAVCVEGLLFHFHLHGRGHLDVLVHTLLVYTILAEAACLLVEMARRRSALSAFGRAYFGVLQATWFFQIGFILYSPLPNSQPWKENHHNMMVATAVYTWHMVGALVYLGLM
ncbi:unnamed protein product, partial [Ixodes hexagonus]